MASINNEVAVAMNRYYESLSELRRLGIIRSDTVAGNIGEFVASRILGVELEANQRARSIDGRLNGRRVQVKYSQTTAGKNINVGNPNDYEDLILVLHSRCSHFPQDNASDFVMYTIPSEEIIEHFTRSEHGKYTCTSNMINEIDNIQQRNISYTDLNVSQNN